MTQFVRAGAVLKLDVVLDPVVAVRIGGYSARHVVVKYHLGPGSNACQRGACAGVQYKGAVIAS